MVWLVLLKKKKGGPNWGGHGDTLSWGFILLFCYGLLKNSNLHKLPFTHTRSLFGLISSTTHVNHFSNKKKYFILRLQHWCLADSFFNIVSTLWTCPHNSFPTVYASKIAVAKGLKWVWKPIKVICLEFHWTGYSNNWQVLHNLTALQNLLNKFKRLGWWWWGNPHF